MKREKMKLNLRSLTALEVADIEVTLGEPLHRLGDPDAPNQTRMAIALNWIAQRRESPEITFEEVAGQPFAEIDALEIVGEIGGAVLPTDAATSSSARHSATHSPASPGAITTS